MASSSHKLEVKESEKTPKVLMNNWSLDVLLGKEMGRLGKSEKTVVNRFTMEQKILHKRYKKMMHQSKLSLARITSNHAMEKEIRSQTAVRFNTNLGADDEDDMLRRTWDYGRRRRACTLSSSSSGTIQAAPKQQTRIKSAPSKMMRTRTSGRRKVQQTPELRVNIVEQEEEEGDRGVYLTGPLSQDSGISLVDEEEAWTDTPVTAVPRASISQRPMTAAVIPAERKMLRQKSAPVQDGNLIKRVASANVGSGTRQRKTGVVEIPKLTKEETTDVLKTDLDPAEEVKDSDKLTADIKDTGNNELDVKLDSRVSPEPKGQFLETYLSVSASPAAVHRPPSNQSTHVEAGNFKEFVHETLSKEPGGRPNLLDIQKVRVRLADYNSKVKDFNSKVAHLRAPSSAITDYYTSRLMETSHKKYTPLVTMDNPPEHEMRREMGNTKLKSMTFKPLDKNFDKRPSTFIDISVL